jgi:hypothetical protein
MTWRPFAFFIAHAHASMKGAVARPTRAAGSGEGKHSGTNSPKTKNDASDNDCTNERPDKYFGPSAASGQVANKIASNTAEHSADYGRGL